MKETTLFMLWVFPLLSFSTLALLYWLNRSLLDEEDGLLPGLLYLSCANVILIPLFLDQAIYPPVFLLGVAVMTARRTQAILQVGSFRRRGRLRDDVSCPSPS